MSAPKRREGPTSPPGPLGLVELNGIEPMTSRVRF